MFNYPPEKNCPETTFNKDDWKYTEAGMMVNDSDKKSVTQLFLREALKKKNSKKSDIVTKGR